MSYRRKRMNSKGRTPKNARSNLRDTSVSSSDSWNSVDLNGEESVETERFDSVIKQIKDHVKPEIEGISKDAIELLNSLINSILVKVSSKAKSNTSKYRKKIISYTDIMVAAMNTFGDENKWIEAIIREGEKESAEYEEKIPFSEI